MAERRLERAACPPMVGRAMPESVSTYNAVSLPMVRAGRSCLFWIREPYLWAYMAVRLLMLMNFRFYGFGGRWPGRNSEYHFSFRFGLTLSYTFEFGLWKARNNLPFSYFVLSPDSLLSSEGLCDKIARFIGPCTRLAARLIQRHSPCRMPS